MYGMADEYISRLHGMLERHLSIPFELYCYTDSHRNLSSQIRQIDCNHWANLERPNMGVFQKKLGLFNPEYVPFSEFIYLDLTLVICKNMDSLVAFAREKPEDLVILKDWNYDCYNSCVMRIRNKNLRVIYDSYAHGVIYPYHIPGDQDYIHSCLSDNGLKSNVSLFPEGSVVSYKNTRQKGKRYPAVAHKIFYDAVIVKFHGKPKMHLALNPIYHFSKLLWYGLLRGRASIGTPLHYLRSNWLGK
jgi:hypothetical protein